MFEHRRTQSPKPGAVPPPELQTQIHDHVTSGHVPKSRCPRQVDRNLPNVILDIDTAQEDPSGTTVPQSQKQHPQQNVTQHVTKLARWSGREVGIVINAGPATRTRKREIVDYAKFGFEHNGQRAKP